MADGCESCRQLREDLAQAGARIAALEAALAERSAAAPAVAPLATGSGNTATGMEASDLRRERDRMAAILHGISDLCVAVDRQWRFTYLNPQAEAFYDRTAADLLGKVAWEELPPLVGTDFQRKCFRAMEQQETAHFEVPSKLRPGRWLEFRIGPTHEGIGIFGTDITARKHAEQQLQILNETLEQRVAERTAEAEQRASQLRRLTVELTRTEQRERRRLAQLLHDHLQQLLVAAKLNLGSLRSRTRSEPMRDALGRVNEMLVAALEASRSLTVELSPPILRKGSLRDVLHWLAGWIKSRHGLTVHVQADCPAEVESQEIRGLLFQVVRELLFNVVKHAGVEEASVELQCEDGWLKVTVTDQGVGFEPSAPVQDDSPGTGFGLFSARERLELMGGRLEIDSTPGRGTRMTLVAPVRLSNIGAERPSEEPATAAPAPQPAAPAGRAGPVQSRRIRVLLADDHPLVQDGLRRLLAAQDDIEIVGQAVDGRQAVELAMQLRPDVVIMDVDMPQLDGVEATRQIHAQLPHVRVIGLSMLNESSVGQSMIAAGAVRYLTKTALPEVLVEAVQRQRMTR